MRRYLDSIYSGQLQNAVISGMVLAILLSPNYARADVPAANNKAAPASRVTPPPATPVVTGSKKPALGSSRPRAADTKPVNKGSPTPASDTVIDVEWEKLWEVEIGSTFRWGQIAARGPLIAIASRGLENQNDPLDGVHIIDGRNLPASQDRWIRTLNSPVADAAVAGSSDAIGVALDGDFVVFGTLGGLVTKVRLDGWVMWTVPVPPGLRPSVPALIDVNGDRKLDAVVPLMPVGTSARSISAVCLDGRDGKQLWSIGFDRNGGAVLGDRTNFIRALSENVGDESPCRERAVTLDTLSPVTIVLNLICDRRELVEGAFTLSALAASGVPRSSGELQKEHLGAGELEARGLARGSASYVLGFDARTLRLRFSDGLPSPLRKEHLLRSSMPSAVRPRSPMSTRMMSGTCSWPRTAGCMRIRRTAAETHCKPCHGVT